jgi:hypothetical protein
MVEQGNLLDIRSPVGWAGLWVGSSLLILSVSWLLAWLMSILIGRLLSILLTIGMWLLLERRRTRYRPAPRHATYGYLPVGMHNRSKTIENG